MLMPLNFARRLTFQRDLGKSTAKCSLVRSMIETLTTEEAEEDEAEESILLSGRTGNWLVRVLMLTPCYKFTAIAPLGSLPDRISDLAPIHRFFVGRTHGVTVTSAGLYLRPSSSISGFVPSAASASSGKPTTQLPLPSTQRLFTILSSSIHRFDGSNMLIIPIKSVLVAHRMARSSYHVFTNHSSCISSSYLTTHPPLIRQSAETGGAYIWPSLPFDALLVHRSSSLNSIFKHVFTQNIRGFSSFKIPSAAAAGH